MRSVERLEGLALVGRATLGGLSLPLPGLLESRTEAAEPPGLSLRSVEAPLAQRHLRISDGTSTLDIEFPVPSPEVVGPPGGVVLAGPGTLLVRPPFPPTSPAPGRFARPSSWSGAMPAPSGRRDFRSSRPSGNCARRSGPARCCGPRGSPCPTASRCSAISEWS